MRPDKLSLLALLVCCQIVAAAPLSQFFDAKGVKLHYLIEGQGRPVVLIHGLNASAQTNWGMPGIIAALAKDHQVIALDLPGHGRSDKPAAPDAYGLQMAEDVILLLDHLKIPKAHIVGYSMGGMVAVKLMAMHPDRVVSAVIGGMGWLREGSPLQKSWERMPVREGSRTPAAAVHGLGKLAVSEPEIRAIRVPTIVLVGDRDPVLRLYVDPLRRVRSDWRVVEIAGAGHLNCIVKKQFVDEIVSWLARP